MDKIDYEKINFRRRTVQYARSYTEESNAGGGITHTPKPGTVLDDGVLPTPENMAYIDGKIKELVDAANALIEEAEALERTVSAQGTSIGNNARGISDAQRVNEQQSAAIAALTSAHNALAEDEEALEMSFNTFTARRDNPNQVTKAQVGLGSVPNVSTNDQTPTFTEATSNQNLASGEKLSLSLGKIARGLKKLWEHITATGNVHNMKAADIGAFAPIQGEYTGNDATSRKIELFRDGETFTPTVVIYCDETGTFADDIKGACGGIIYQGSPQYNWALGYESTTRSATTKVAEIVSGGFMVYSGGSSNHTRKQPNKSGIKYRYIAW